MSFHAQKAKKIFDDAKQHISPESNPVMWDLVNGLAELCLAVNVLQADIDSLKRKSGGNSV
jgi:hypothetical protein